MRNYQELPKLKDSISFLYLEKVSIHKAQNALEAINQDGRIQIPVAALTVLMLGPGVSITHRAVEISAKNGCSIIWVGEEGTRFYAQGVGETHKGYHLIRQAELVSDDVLRKQVVIRMYEQRFGYTLDKALSLPSIRGMEGARMKQLYREWSEKAGVSWYGRNYNMNRWGGDPINRALSSANALLNGLCHAAIVSGGYSPGLGFVHQGRRLSFVYDVADLYKAEITIPVAFETVAKFKEGIEKETRFACREIFRKSKLLARILPDIDRLFRVRSNENEPEDFIDVTKLHPFELWEPLMAEEEMK